MKVTANKQPKNVLEVVVEIDAKEFETYLKKAATRISEQTEIPGFRKGAAPFEIVKGRVGEMALYQEAAGMAIDQTLGKALAEQKVEYAGQPEVRVDKLAPGNPFVYTITLSLLPEIKLPDFSKAQVTRKPLKVSEEEVDKVINDLREIRATEAATDKAVEKGDLVHIDFDVFKDKVAVDGGQGRKYPLVIGKGAMIPGFEDNLIGLKKGDVKEFKLKFPADYPNKMLAGNMADFKVTVLQVFKREMPALNDEFVKQFGKFDNVEAFRKAVRGNIEDDNKRRAESALEIEMLEKLTAAATIGDLPEPMIQAESRKMVDELHENIEQQGMKFEDYLVQIKKNETELALGFMPEAVKRLKFMLVIRSVAKQENIKATPEEMETELKMWRERYKTDPQAQQRIDTPAFKNYVENFLVNRKTVEFLKSKLIK